MPLAQSTDQLASKAGTMMPATRNCFKLFLLDTTNLGSNPFSAGNVSPLEVTFRPPTCQLEVKDLRVGNVAVHYAGFPTFGGPTLSFNNYVSLHVYAWFYQWWVLASGLTPVNAVLGGTPTWTPGAGINNVTKTLSVPTKYKVAGLVRHYSYPGQQETVQDEWWLSGIWPTLVTAEEYDNENNGDVHRATVEFAVDYAQPVVSSAESFSALGLSALPASLNSASTSGITV